MYTYNDASAFAALSAFIAAYSIVILIFAVVLIIANWKIFSKAGEPGWAAIVPFYNQYVLFKITLAALDATPVVKLPTRVISLPVKVSLFPLT